MCAVAQVVITRNGFAHVFRVVTVAEPLVVLNFTVPCIVDKMAYSRKKAVLRRIISSFDMCLTTENSIILVTDSFPS